MYNNKNAVTMSSSTFKTDVSLECIGAMADQEMIDEKIRPSIRIDVQFLTDDEWRMLL